MPVTFIQPASQARDQELSRRHAWRSLVNGFQRRCPNCQSGALVEPYLNVVDHCAQCGEIYRYHRADTMPAFLTILIVAQLVLLPMLICIRLWPTPVWPHFIIWPFAAVGLTLLLLPRVKGALVALQWALRLHGFGTSDENP